MASYSRRAMLLVACACAGGALGARFHGPSRNGPSSSLSLARVAGEQNLHVALRQETDQDTVKERGGGKDSVVASLSAGVRLSDTFGQLAAELPAGVTRELFARFKVCTSCANFQRLGEDNDGGYLICMDGLAGNKLRAAYSMGVERHDKWSVDMYKRFKVPIHQFDCTVNGPAQNCGDCHFHKVCIAGSKGGGSWKVGPTMNMQQVLSSTGMASAPNGSLVMKMDIEGSEWPIFAEGSTGLSKFEQLIIEFHYLGQKKLHAQYVSALRNIENAGFKVAHIHGNNAGHMFYIGGFAIPCILEVTFVKEGPTLNACKTEQRLHPLDRRNILNIPNLPMAHLPA